MSSSARPDANHTHAALLDAGEALLASDANFSMGAVARRAGVSRQAVYLHFDDRFALLDAIVKRAISQSGADTVRARLLDAPTADGALELLVEATVAIASRHGALERAVRDVVASDAGLSARWAARPGRGEVMRTVAQRLHDEGRLRPALDVPSAARALRTLTAGDVCIGLFDIASREEVAAMLLRAVRAAVCR
ncbi:MAG: TetR/AcrR family transcriptional regulator [Deltaproteobacteria bacterium]|nr:MAG: TetR/AcrR family transcriptional regulator [Deltaproteobacteria bacterium]